MLIITCSLQSKKRQTPYAQGKIGWLSHVL